jgi:hypothetical protein
VLLGCVLQLCWVSRVRVGGCAVVVVGAFVGPCFLFAFSF